MTTHWLQYQGEGLEWRDIREYVQLRRKIPLGFLEGGRNRRRWLRRLRRNRADDSREEREPFRVSPLSSLLSGHPRGTAGMLK